MAEKVGLQVEVETAQAKQSLQELRQILKLMKEEASQITDPKVLKSFNSEIQSLEKEIKQLSNAGKAGFDEMGNAIGKSTNYAGKAFGALRNLANVLPGVGIAGILAFAVEPIINYIKSLSGANEAQEALNNSVQDYKKGATDAIVKVNEVSSAFDLAREGVISKKEALKTYNDTLGDSLGRTNDLGIAEKNLLDKADAYIQITALKARANALFAKSAEQTANSLTAGAEDQTSFIEKGISGLNTMIYGASAGYKSIVESQIKGAKKVSELADANAKILNDAGVDILKQADVLKKNFKITDEKVGKELNQAAEKAANKARQAAEKAQRESEARVKKAKELQDKLNDDLAKANKTAREKDLLDLEQKFEDYKKILIAGGLSTVSAEEFYLAKRKEVVGKYDDANKKKFDEDLAKRIENERKKNEKLLDEEKRHLKEKEELGKSQGKDLSLNTKDLLKNDGFTEDEKKATLQATLDYINSDLGLQQYGADERTRLARETSEAIMSIDEKEKDHKLKMQSAVASGLNAVSEIVGQNTVVGKALAVSASLISTYSAIAGQLAAFSKIPIPGYAIAQAFATGLVGLNAVKNILKVKVPGKGGGIGSISSPSLPQAAAPPQAVSNVTTLDKDAINALGNQALRAYVVENDITNSQGRIQRIKRSAILG